MNTAIIFPGQGAQSLGMLSELAKHKPIIRETFEASSSALGFDLWALCQSDEAALNETENTQPALLTAGMAVWRLLQQEKGIEADCFAGHSLGEYTALTAAGVMSLEDAVSLVRLRGQLMQQAVPQGVGTMAAVLGVSNEIINDVCQSVSGNEVVSAANYNAIGQTVIAGHTKAVERASSALLESGAKRIVPLAVSVPSHCLLMKSAADQLLETLNSMSLNPATKPVISNAKASELEFVPDVIDALYKQLYLPVRWVESVQLMVNNGCEQALECGPGGVLMGLNRKIDRAFKTTSINDLKSLESI